MRRGPSHGRGPNAAHHERIVAYETNRAGWYPAPGAYLACVRRAFSVTDAGGRISLGWTDAAGHDREAWRREFRRALHARINAKGGNRYSRFNDPRHRGIAPEYRREPPVNRDRPTRSCLSIRNARGPRTLRRSAGLLCRLTRHCFSPSF